MIQFLWTTRYRSYLVWSKLLVSKSFFNSVIPIYTFQVEIQNELSYVADPKRPRKQSTCSNCGKHGHNKRNCPGTSSNTPAPASAPIAQPKAGQRNSRAEEIKDENGIQPPLHDDPDESDDEEEEMFQEFKEALEKLVWTEIPATDPPTLPTEIFQYPKRVLITTPFSLVPPVYFSGTNYYPRGY